MLHCPNKSSQEWENLVQAVGEKDSYLLWAAYDGEVPERYYEKKETPVVEEDKSYKGFDLGSKIESLKNTRAGTALENVDNKPTKKGNNFRDLHESILFDGLEGMSSFKAKDILTNIVESAQYELTSNMQFFLKQASSIVDKTGAKVKMVSKDDFYKLDKDFDEKTMMSYNPSNNTIYISRDVISTFTPDLVISAFIHEAAHSTTVQAYRKPANITEQMFKDTIDQGFKQYKDIARENGTDGEYGFTNPLEFISEIYSNPQFRNDVSKLEGWWKSFINSIRRLFNLPASSNTNDMIEAAVLFNAVDSFVQLNKSTWEGTAEDSEYLQVKASEDLFTNLSTTEDKIDNTIEKFNESIQRSIDHFKIQSSRKNNKNSDNIKAYLKSLYELQDDINVNSEANKAKSIIDFVEYMSKNLDRIEKTLLSVDIDDVESVKNVIKRYDDYLSLYSVVDSAISSVNEMLNDDKQNFIKPKELMAIRTKLSANKGKFEVLKDEMNVLKKKALARRIDNIKYFPNIEKKHYDRLSKEHKEAKIPENKSAWIARQMNGRDKDIIEADVRVAINDLLNNPSIDIYASDVLLSSAINVSDPLIQILNQWLQEIDNDRIKTERAKDREFKDIYDALVADRGTNNIKELYKNILEFDKDGKAFLKGEYKADFYTEVYKEIKKIRYEHRSEKQELWDKAKEAKTMFGQQSKQYKEATNKVKESVKKKDDAIKAIEQANLNLDKKGKFLSIKASWKNKTTKLSDAEQKTLDFFIANTEEGKDATDGKASLIKFAYKAKFYELPKIHKSTAERIWTGEGSGLLKDKWKDMTEIRSTDLEFGGVSDTVTKDVGVDNQQINSLKIAYRDYLKPQDQSLDLMGIYRLDYKNTNGYSIRKDSEMDMNIMTDVVKNKGFYDKTGSQFILKKSTGKINIKEAGSANTLKMINNMIETRFYGVYKKSNVKMAGMDANKFVQNLNSISSFLALTGNIASGTLNVLNANSQLFFESFLKGHYITASGIAKANAVYSSNLLSTLSDTINPINEGFVNQLMEEFNVDGIIHLSDSNFLQTDLLKKALSKDVLHATTASGEHYVKSIIAMSVLDGVKVMDSNFNFIDKEGNKVEEDKAASLLDMHKINEETGLLEVDDKVIYTTNSRTTKYNEGGKDKVDSLIYKKMYDSIGNYRQIDQPDLYRHWWGNMVGLYRKYLIPMGTARMRGLETSFKRKEDLTDYEKRFSYALQENEEGTYTSLVRYIATSLRDKKYYILSKSNWDNLSDYEKHNIKRSVVELVTIFVLLPMVTALAAGAADGDDDDELYFVAYASRRLETELSQYISIGESFKVLRSPIPSTRLIETALDLFGKVFNPFNWDEIDDIYEKGSHKGENKLKIKFEKQVPGVKEFIKSYKDLYEFQNSSWGTGVS